MIALLIVGVCGYARWNITNHGNGIYKLKIEIMVLFF